MSRRTYQRSIISQQYPALTKEVGVLTITSSAPHHKDNKVDNYETFDKEEKEQDNHGDNDVAEPGNVSAWTPVYRGPRAARRGRYPGRCVADVITSLTV